MKISWIKNKEDKQSFSVIQNLGGTVYELDDPEKVDQTIENLYKKENYNTIIIIIAEVLQKISLYTVLFACIQYISIYKPAVNSIKQNVCWVCTQKKNIPCVATRDIHCLFTWQIARIKLQQ